MESLDSVVFILIVCAGALAFIVLYNLTNINIQERKDTLSFYLFSLSSSKSFIFISNPPA